MPTIHDIIQEEYLHNSVSGPGDTWLISSRNVLRDLTTAVGDLRRAASKCEGAIVNIERISERIADKWHADVKLVTLEVSDNTEPHIGICADHPDNELMLEVMFCLGFGRHYWRVWSGTALLVKPKRYEYANDLNCDVIDFVDALGGGV